MGVARKLYEQLARRAVYTVTAVQAVLSMFVAFGLDWTAEQVAAVVIATSAILALVFGQDMPRRPPTSE